MKINPFEIAKKINRSLKNKDQYKSRIEGLKKKPLAASTGKAKAIYDIETNRILRIECEEVDPRILLNITEAVWEEFSEWSFRQEPL